MLELTEIRPLGPAGPGQTWEERPLLLAPRHIVSARPRSGHPYDGAVYEVQMVTGARYDVTSAMIGDDPQDWAAALSLD
jgi:hypothetical protein